jgi:hypothetical protein
LLETPPHKHAPYSFSEDGLGLHISVRRLTRPNGRGERGAANEANDDGRNQDSSSASTASGIYGDMLTAVYHAAAAGDIDYHDYTTITTSATTTTNLVANTIRTWQPRRQLLHFFFVIVHRARN